MLSSSCSCRDSRGTGRRGRIRRQGLNEGAVGTDPWPHSSRICWWNSLDQIVFHGFLNLTAVPYMWGEGLSQGTVQILTLRQLGFWGGRYHSLFSWRLVNVLSLGREQKALNVWPLPCLPPIAPPRPALITPLTWGCTILSVWGSHSGLLTVALQCL